MAQLHCSSRPSSALAVAVFSFIALVWPAFVGAQPASKPSAPASAPIAPAQPQAVLHEVRVSDVLVGYDPAARKPLFHRVSLAVMVSVNDLNKLPSEVSGCLRRIATVPAVNSLRVQLSADRISKNEAFETAADPAARLKAKADNNALVDGELDRLLNDIEKRAASCGKRADRMELQVALVRRLCLPDGPACSNQPTLTTLNDSAAAGWVLTRWLLSRTEKVPDAKRLNEYMVLATQEDRPADRDVVNISLQAPKVLDDAKWPASVGAAQDVFEEGVRWLRASGKKYPVAAPVLAGMPIQIAVATADVLDSPAEAVSYLESKVDATLQRVSDEIARTRIRECVQFRSVKPTAEQVLGCTGYQIGDSEIEKCLLGAGCRAKLTGKDTYLGVIELVKQYDVATLAKSNLMPRLPLGEYGPMVDAYRKCVSEGKVSDNECAMTSGMGKDARKAFDCAKKQDPDGQLKLNAAAFDCVLGSSISKNERELFDCANSNKAAMKEGAYKGTIRCALGTVAPKEALAIAECYSNGKRDSAKCALNAVGGKDLGRINCLRESKTASASLGCLGDKLPPDARKALECTSSSSDAAGLALCVAASGVLKGDVGKLAKCAVSSQGNPLGTGVCMYGDKLTADQRILLQCAASTGGVPVTMGVCVLGQMGMKALVECKGKKFGEGPCFGHGNEMQKLVKAITGDYIKPSSVVGQLLNAHLDVFKGTAGLIQAGLKGVKNLAENTGHELDKIRHKPIQALTDAPANIVRETGKAAEWLGDRLGVSKPLKKCCRIKW